MAKSMRNELDSTVPLRIGTVPYCNAWPLVHFLPNELPGSIISKWIPSTMRLRLMAHHLDLALMPVAELMNLPYGKIVGDCCIACRGPVQSVRLISKKSIEKIETLALDTASRSSITMCDLILRHFYDLKPTRYKLNLKESLDSCKFDAFVVIGDRALSYQPSDIWEYRYDLGELWYQKTGLPFVFAAWIACTDRIWREPTTLKAFGQSRNRGLEQIDTILDEQQRSGIEFPVSRSEMKDYFTESIIYRLGEEEKLGIQSFFDLALLHGLAKHRTVVDVVEIADSI